MATADTPYISKAAAPLVNPTVATIFTQQPNPLATIAANQPTQSAYVVFKGYSAAAASGFAAGVSNEQNLIYLVIRAGGRVQGGTTTNFTQSLYLGRTLGTGNTPGTGTTLIGSLTPQAYNSASGNWIMQAFLSWDPVSGQINGNIGGWGGSAGVQTPTATAFITPVTGQTLANPAVNVAGAYSSGELALFFSVGGVFSASNANNIATLDMFEAVTL